MTNGKQMPGDLCQEYRSLNIANSTGVQNTLAKAVFVCIGVSTGNSPACTITASADHWTGYPKLSNFVKKLRQMRRMVTIGDVGRGRNKGAPLIVEWSEDLWKRRLDENESLSSLVAHPKGYFSHLYDVATPLKCPSFKPKARCQALFEYAVPDDVRERERTETALYQGFTCAETYAHLFCRQLGGKGHAPCVRR